MYWDKINIKMTGRKMDKVVGIGEIAVSNSSDDKIKTYALASCVAVTAYHPTRKLGGMVHVALPSVERHSPETRPGFYAVTGVPLLINSICQEYGCFKEELAIRIYGGAESSYENDVFNIGRRNIDAVKKALKDLNLEAVEQNVGGKISRTIELDMETGKVNIQTQSITI